MKTVVIHGLVLDASGWPEGPPSGVTPTSLSSVDYCYGCGARGGCEHTLPDAFDDEPTEVMAREARS